MSKKLIHRLFAAAIAACVLAPPPQALADNTEKVYNITFGARGESRTVDKVTVENLTNGHSASLGGSDTLVLKANAHSGVESLTKPQNGNLMIVGGNLLVSTLRPADIRIFVYTIDGRLVWQTRQPSTAIHASVELPQLGRGVYIVRATAPGFDKSIKWLASAAAPVAVPEIAPGNGTESLSQTILNDITHKPTHSAEASSVRKCVELEYAEGDVLKFTGTSGKMRTITMNTPRSDHPVYFDFFKCEDANGYNYTIVRAGDMLWMAEDLKAVQADGITDASSMQASEIKTAMDAKTALMAAVDGSTTYYNQAAAKLALPAGWSLPTQGELDFAFNNINGGDYSTIGSLLKGNDPESIDRTSLRICTSGRFDGSVADTGNAYLLTRNTKGGNQLGLANDGNAVTFEDCAGHLLPVRGVRPAPSPYAEMIEKFGYGTKYGDGTEGADTTEIGPMGEHFSLYTEQPSIAYDFTGGQYQSDKKESRSGIFNMDMQNRDKYYVQDCRDDSFVSDGNEYAPSKLRKMAHMSNKNGSQYVVEMQWSRPMRLWTQYNSATGKYERTDSPDVFTDKNDEGVYITITGDRTDNYKIKNKPADAEHKGFFLPLNAEFLPLPKDILPYFRYNKDRLATETRIDYVQRVFQLLTADFNSDGVDDIVIHIDGAIWVYDGATMLADIAAGRTDNPKTISKPMYQSSMSQKYCGENYYLKKRFTRIAVGDVTGDGKPDIVKLDVGYGTVDYDLNPTIVAAVLIYPNGDVSGQTISVAKTADFSGWENAVFNDIKVGNVTGSALNDIVVLRRDYSGKAIAQSATMYLISLYKSPYNGEIYPKQWKEGEDYSYCKTSNVTCFKGGEGHMGNNNITLLHLPRNGQRGCADISVGSERWRWNSEKEILENQGTDKDESGLNIDMSRFNTTYDGMSFSILADNIIEVNYNECETYRRELHETQHLNSLVFYNYINRYDNSGRRYGFVALENMTNKTTSISGKYNWWYMPAINNYIMKYSDNGAWWSKDDAKRVGSAELMWWFGDNDAEWGSSAALCSVQDVPSIKYLKFKKHQMAFSEPRIYAALAAPPSYDYSDEPKADPNYEAATSWGFSRKNSQETASSSSLSSSLIVGFEFEITAPIVGTKLGGVDFSTKIQQEVTKGWSDESSVSYTQRYDARDDDRIVMQTTPYDHYVYEVVESANPDEVGGEMTISVPQQPITMGLALKDYDTYMADNPNAPNFHELFKHQVGNPFSYPASNEDIKSTVGSSVLWGNGRWDDFVTIGSGGSVTREIELDETKAQSAEFSFGVESELVVTAGCVKAGAGFGYNKTNSSTHSESKGFTVSACVPGLKPGDTSPDRKFFQWNMCWYKYRLGNQTFPVVNYVVKRPKW